MTPEEIRTQLTATYPGLSVVEVDGDTFIGYDPRHPFVTLVTGDRHDTASNLDREGAFRLNIGVERATYERLFGPRPTGFDVPPGYDHTVADVVAPHPTYASMSWVCIVDPTEATAAQWRPLLAEAETRARRELERRTPREPA